MNGRQTRARRAEQAIGDLEREFAAASAPDPGTVGFTPGPWECSQESVDPEWWIVTIKGGLIVANVNAHYRQIANARLIAAAPCLLAAAEALEQAETFHANCEECEGDGIPEACPDCFPHFDKARVLSRAAIARARGEQP